MEEVSRIPLLGREEELELARRYQATHDLAAAHQLVVANLRFVVRTAHEYRGYGLQLLDLIQEGNIGLMKAVQKFDPERGYRLVTYAVWWIRAQIQEFILRSWSLVRISTGRVARKLFFKLRSERSEAEHAARGAVTTSEIATRLGVPESEVTDMEARMAARDFSLDAPLSDTSRATFQDTLGDEPDQESELTSREELAQLRTAVDRVRPELQESEALVLEERLLSDEPLTMAEAGKRLGVSRQRVHQIEGKLLDKIRRALPPPAARPSPHGVAP
jgi:RNA polymerase sigma-32 factor